ncbi:head-tail adaptor protein [Rufibacter sp. LB8]|uniref:phage head completion protein n=1 Tax=Rufibacter sp. LB8 TaxID=2777781 RepID=UPI00178C76B0|nr:head-tail adaptor protein [Rufibacter sp. LB8]
MLSHKLKHKIEIWETVKVKDSIGATTTTSNYIDSVYSDAVIEAGTVATNEDRVLFTTKGTFIVRNYPTITYNHYIKFNSDVFKIISIQDLLDGTGRKITAFKND